MKQSRMLWVGGVAIVAALVLGFMVAVLGQKSATPAQAQTTPAAGPNGYSGITVQGTGVVILQPDVVRLNVGVTLKAATVSDAQKQSADTSAKITDALKAAGIKAEDIKTVNYSINPDYTYEPNQPPKLNGYQIDNTLQVTIRDVTKTGSIIDAASTAGANQINGINFTVENNTDALKQARAAAVADAKAKADQLAAAGQVQVGSIINIVEVAQNADPVPMVANDARAAAAGSAATQIESGQLKVVVNVQVTFGISK
ncbi:MAG: SIMPL domain-containing protein [Chloroflexi bacterium]|nr:SIMPL domain-containing protein [Chloroflexota bacterium]OJV97066.1 MAG: hypothetical protein BGO39_18855 [Chloroflexi bacterium 54-19]